MVTAFVLVTVEPDTEKEVLQEVRSVEGVKEAHLTNSIFDIIVIAELEGDNAARLKGVVLGIREVADVTSTVTLLVAEGVRGLEKTGV